MAQIIETQTGDRRLSLGNEEYFRPTSIGPNWGKVRIGIRFAINGRADIASPAYLQLGLGCDATSYYSSDRPTGYIGCRFGGSADNNPNITFNFSQAQNSYYSFGNTESTTISKDSTGLVTQSARIATGGVYFATANSALSTEHYIMATFGRAGNTYTLIDTIVPITAASVQTGKTAAQFIADMDNETFAAPAISNATRNTSGMPLVIAPAATFNAPSAWYVSVYWSKSTPSIEISHLAVTRFF